jgi:hypothetical protein
MVAFDCADATDTRPHCDTAAVCVGLIDREARVLDGLDAGGDAVVHERIALACFFGLEVLRDVEIADRSGEARGERARVEMLDERNAAHAVADVVPTLGDGIAHGRNQP